MKKNIIIPYLLTQLFLYCSILFLDINIPNTILTYSIIFLNLILGIYALITYKDKDAILSTCALFFTLVSDTFLIFTEYKIPALITFSLVQSFYMIKVKDLTSQFKITYFDIARAIVVFASTTLMLLISVDLLVTITAFYFVMLVFNFIDSIKLFKNIWLLPVGFLLFILCDVFVGLGFLEIDLNIHFNIIWFFYTPSQVLLTLSIFYAHKSKKA
jgi:hypothetical protein